MPAPLVTVPCDFGVENLHDELHGNVDIEFVDSTTMRVNSIVLSWNSDVFKTKFTELREKTVQIKDFSKPSVVLFLELLYSGGNLGFLKSSFREVNTMAHVFRVSWLSAHCVKFFMELCATCSQESDYEDFVFFFSEAAYWDDFMDNTNMMDIVVNNFSKIEHIAVYFVGQYLKEHACSVRPNILVNLLKIAGKECMPIITAIEEHLLSGGDINEGIKALLVDEAIIHCFAVDTDAFNAVQAVFLSTAAMSEEDAAVVEVFTEGVGAAKLSAEEAARLGAEEGREEASTVGEQVEETQGADEPDGHEAGSTSSEAADDTESGHGRLPVNIGSKRSGSKRDNCAQS